MRDEPALHSGKDQVLHYHGFPQNQGAKTVRDVHPTAPRWFGFPAGRPPLRHRRGTTRAQLVACSWLAHQHHLPAHPTSHLPAPTSRSAIFCCREMIICSRECSTFLEPIGDIGEISVSSALCIMHQASLLIECTTCLHYLNLLFELRG